MAEAVENTTDSGVNTSSETQTVTITSAEQKTEDNTSTTTEAQVNLDALTQELNEWKDKYIRLYSEFENFRRRTAKEKADLILNASEQMILALLPVADDIDRARQNLAQTTDLDVLKEGTELIFHKFYKILESKGLKPLEAKGQPFNPELHEAITQIPSPTPEQKGTVLDEIEKGYYLHDKLIRVAKVVTGA